MNVARHGRSLRRNVELPADGTNKPSADLGVPRNRGRSESVAASPLRALRPLPPGARGREASTGQNQIERLRSSSRDARITGVG